MFGWADLPLPHTYNIFLDLLTFHIRVFANLWSILILIFWGGHPHKPPEKDLDPFFPYFLHFPSPNFPISHLPSFYFPDCPLCKFTSPLIFHFINTPYPLFPISLFPNVVFHLCLISSFPDFPFPKFPLFHLTLKQLNLVQVKNHIY